MKKRIFSILLSIGMMLTLLPGTVLAAGPDTTEDIFIDNTVDNSVSIVTGVVYITGSGGKQAGYYEGKTVYEGQENVTYSNPKTDAVQGRINDAETIVYNLSEDVKERGKRGEYHGSTGTSTGRVWDHRRYKTYEYNPATGNWERTIDGQTEVYSGEIPSDAGINTRIHVASGDYGKETYYRVEANGWVAGYDITTAADPAEGGTATSDLTASLSGETVTFTATPADGYEFHHWEVVDSSGKKQSRDANYSYTMPASDVTATAVFTPAPVGLATGRSDGGTLKVVTTYGTFEDAWMSNINVVRGSQVVMTATPAEGYEFAGYYEGIFETDRSKEGYGFVTDYDPEKPISNDKNYTYTATEELAIYALFKKEEALPTLTLHWSSIDGVDLVEPIMIENIEKGTQVHEALGTIDLNMMSHPFEKEGYIASDYKVNKPITDYADRDAMENDGVDAFAPIESNMDIYCIMMKAVDTVEVTVDSPVCGTIITAPPTEGYPWSQADPPSVSIPDGAGYKPYIAYDGASPAIWVNSVPDYEPFEGTIIGEEEHAAEIWLDTDFGYIFPDDVGITVNGGTLVEKIRTPGSLAIIASVTAVHDPAEPAEENREEPTCTEAGSYDEVVYCNGCHTELSHEKKEIPALGHDWGEWIVDKEATEEEDGLRHHVCSRCETTEEEVIPKIEVSYGVAEGDDAIWYTGSNDSLTFTFKRSVNDEKTFELFQRIEIDGKEVAPANYEAKAGSVIITLKPEYIKTLAVGKHTLTAVFENGKTADATFTIAEKKADVVPGGDTAKKGTGVKTGDNANTVLYMGLGIAALLIIAVTLILLKRRERQEQ